MKLEIVIDGEEKTVVLTEVDGQYVAEIDGESRTYSVETPEPDVILLKNEGAIFEATVGKVGEELAVSIKDSEFYMSVYDPKSLRGSAASAGGADGAAEMVSAMPGKVVSVLVEEGTEVKAGDGVMIVEAMKMQNELKAPKDGTVSSIRVAADDRVNAGDLLAIVE